MENLPYKASQTTSKGASCRHCRGRFAQNEIRIAAMIQSFKMDAKEEHWHHLDCFFTCYRPRSTDQIAYIENLHPDNQKKILDKVAAANEALVPQAGPSNANKRKIEQFNARLQDFGVEYAKSGRSTCAGCGDKIVKNEVRVIFTCYETEVGKRYGGQNFSHHPECFVEIRKNYNFFLGGKSLPGFHSLTKEDQDMIENVIQVSDGTEAKPKKKSKKTKEEQPPQDLEKLIEEQTLEYLQNRTSLQELSQAHLRKFLTVNGFGSSKEYEKMLDQAADFLTFGAIESCSKCITGDLILAKGGYVCNGVIDEYTSCDYFTAKPARRHCKITDQLKRSSPNFLATYRSRVKERALRPKEENKLVYERQEVGSVRNFSVKRKKREPLYGLHLSAVGRLDIDRKVLKAQIEKMGGRLVSKLQEKIAAVISNEYEVEKMNKRMQEVKRLNIQVVPEDFVSSIENGTREEAIEKIKTLAISEWGSDPMSRIPADEELRPIVKVIFNI
jgi:poly [ADP-ribose] polymerase